MAVFECQQFEIGLEFVRWSFAERNNLSDGSSEPKSQPHKYLNSNYLLLCWHKNDYGN